MDQFDIDDILNPPPQPPSPEHPPPPHPPPPHNPLPPPPRSHVDFLRFQINDSIRSIQDQINVIQNEALIPPHLRHFASSMQNVVDVVRSIDVDLEIQ
jgi:hypothetical protein